jgi:hypothetical protein
MSRLSDYLSNDAHIRIKIKGSAENQMLFHYLLKHLDMGWPFEMNGQPRSSFKRDGMHMIRWCEKCEGFVYTRPRLTARDVKAAARQCGVRVKIIQYAEDRKCEAPGGVMICSYKPLDDIASKSPMLSLASIIDLMQSEPDDGSEDTTIAAPGALVVIN